MTKQEFEARELPKPVAYILPRHLKMLNFKGMSVPVDALPYATNKEDSTVELETTVPLFTRDQLLQALAARDAKWQGEVERLNRRWDRSVTINMSLQNKCDTTEAERDALSKKWEEERNVCDAVAAERDAALMRVASLQMELTTSTELIRDNGNIITKGLAIIDQLRAELASTKTERDNMLVDAAKYNALKNSGYLTPEEFDSQLTEAMRATK